ncbi:hypothetical protein B1R32_12510 [Abditibacterium utsteinense]|uniref:ABM domain-containing protein n=1 Tax=Abditibacterium utsteinense TaxID=1960156 RepID=A0A2S8SPE2_9BACT|nr:antibiotic biosynthesis monooxygenase [Abditibacterium utsteinense]PQV62661.1 hypothetical protein B1R32_12510 [Abditibacterium utsteinense]
MSEPVTVQIIRVVRPGSEAAFEAALHEFIASSLVGPDQDGVHVLRPAPGSGSREYGILRRFQSARARDEFYHSALFARWQKTVAPLVEGAPRYETLSGLETWFALPGNVPIVPPPRWKMALVTLLAVFPLSLVLQKLVAPQIHSWHSLLQYLTISSCMVVMLTWVLMPNLTRLLQGWIHPEASKHSSK